jgi:hypothetical protein
MKAFVYTALILLGGSIPAVAGAIPVVSGGTAVLDQFSFPDINQALPELGTAFLSGQNGEFRRAQTFTVGLDGFLDSILVQFDSDLLTFPFPISSYVSEFRLLETSNAAPTNIIATRQTVSLNGQFGTFDLSDSNLFFTAGTVLAFELVGQGGVQTETNGDTYLGGSDYFLNTRFGINEFRPNPIDLRFQTYVNTVSVPEPGTLALCLSALFAMAFAGWRVTKKQTSSSAS